MLIPSIDLQGGRIVQLAQGDRLVVESWDVDGWVRRFEGFPAVQLIDLDAAKSEGSNAALVRQITRRLPCRVGGGVRTVEQALDLLRAGAHKVIFGSALFANGGPALTFAQDVAARLGSDRAIAAVDARGGCVAVEGWRRTLLITPEDAVRQLEPFFGEFLYTNIDREGLMRGIDRAAILRLRDATRRRVTVAGGVTTAGEIEWLDSLGMDAVVGMALYSGRLEATPPDSPSSNARADENR
jgi:phosphoribosylformimino-5-aminoimidazole carboxamide ribotide isomerase